MGPPGLERSCKCAFLAVRGGTGGGTPRARGATPDRIGRASPGARAPTERRKRGR